MSSGGAKPAAMSSNRPYLIRAMHEWIGDNGMTPYLLVDAAFPGVRVPPQSVKDGKVVLNVAPRAVSQLELGNQMIRFNARFGGVSQGVELPVAAVQAIYAQETGQGMMLPQDGETAAPDPDPDPGSEAGEAPKKGAHLRIVK
ncbi:MAG: ClpXP protease specificity-enhancing factor [Chiayiivirga sp.]|jgi:stringent starvation protein B|uniref:ClpXP protease specificity-enhancing factor n=1 Tax=Chiayiivirga sp. TaxID=2041042 RepID=UPI0025B7CF38|nr:ClpXP protease specificity-enhancing factor [Chiayiivirga sp.]MCI1730683.1 ClpXP protease specificity-enhancing factor [Chiayiivirga sp.]